MRRARSSAQTPPESAANSRVYARRCAEASTHAACMRSRHGQSTVEYIALIGCVVTVLALGVVTLPAHDIVAVTISVFETNEPTKASAAALAFVDQAIIGEGPTINDAITRLGYEVGQDEARALVLAHVRRAAGAPHARGRLRPLTDPAWALARAEFNGVGPSVTDGAWSSESTRAESTMRLVAARDEQRWLHAQSPTLARTAVDLGTAGVVGLISAINPATAVAGIVIGAGVAAAESATRGTPAGSRDNDVIICRFVWRTNETTAIWAEHHPLEASRLRLGTHIAAVDISVIRAGRLIQHDVIWSNARVC